MATNATKVFCSFRKHAFQGVFRRVNGNGRAPKVPKTSGIGRGCLKAIAPFMTVQAFSIPGLSWGTTKEDVKAKPQQSQSELIVQEADRLYSNGEVEALYQYLIQYKDMENDEILWRLCRAAVDKGKHSKDASQKKELYYEALGYIQRALILNETSGPVHRWYAILLDYTGEMEGKKQRILNAYKVRDHFQRAIEINPKDATSYHSLGYWCFVFASLHWYEKKIASAIFATPPTATFQEALEYFLKAEEIEPNFYSTNLLMLAKTYMRLEDAKMAYTYLVKCKEQPVKTPDDELAHNEAEKLIDVITVRQQ